MRKKLSRPMLKLLHISDLHFGPHYLPHVGAAVVRFAYSSEPNVIVVSGDLTHRAKRQEFSDAQSFLNSLPDVPMIVVPGNHDVPLYRLHERIFNPHGLYSNYISAERNTIHVLDGMVIAAIDSTSPYRTIINGRIDASHLELCSRAFRDAPRHALRVVVAHHAFATPAHYLYQHTVAGSKLAMTHFLELGVDLVLGGHLHHSFTRHSSEIVRGSCKDAALVIQCGTSTSTRGRETSPNQNSFNLIEVEDGEIRTIHCAYDTTLDEFVPDSQSVVTREEKIVLP